MAEGYYQVAKAFILYRQGHTEDRRNSVGKYFNSDLDVQNIVDRVEDLIYEKGKDEIPSSTIGEIILEVLSETNEMAYVRFASVFKEFKSLDDLERSIAEQRERMKQRKEMEK